MGRYAVIDIGTNSTKIFIGRLTHGRLTALDDQLEVTRLGEGLNDSDELSEPAMERTADAVCRMAAQAHGLGAEKIVAVGTAALRRADNAEEFIDLVRKRCKLRVKVIDGAMEAAYAAAAVGSSLDLDGEAATVFDIGGGSTEIIRMEGETLLGSESLPVGSRLLADTYDLARPIDAEREARLETHIREALEGKVPPAKRLVGLGGTFSTLASMELGLSDFSSDKVHGLSLERDEVEALFDRVAGMKMHDRVALPGLMPARADVIPAGAAIVLQLMDLSGAEQVTVCARGLRHGLFMSRFAGKD